MVVWFSYISFSKNLYFFSFLFIVWQVLLYIVIVIFSSLISSTFLFDFLTNHFEVHADCLILSSTIPVSKLVTAYLFFPPTLLVYIVKK